MNRQSALNLIIGADPAITNTYRGEAKAVASAQVSPTHTCVSVWYKKDGTNGFQIFDTRDQLNDWYGSAADHQEDFAYVAAFDTKDGAWPDPWAEFGDAIHQATVIARPPSKASPSTPAKKSSWLGWLIGTAITGVIGFAIAKRK